MNPQAFAGIGSGKHIAEGDRQSGEEGGFQSGVFLEFQGRVVVLFDESKCLDGRGFRIHDPVFRNPEALIEGELQAAIVCFRCRRQNLDKQVRNTLDILSVMMEKWSFETKIRSGSIT